GVKIIDRHGRFLFINKSAERNMEIVRDEWIGRHAEELIPNSIILKALHTGTPQMHQHSVVLGKHFIVHASPLMYQGDVIG
ncbi:PAS domain-containing protein, partial [Shewanella sp. C32]